MAEDAAAQVIVGQLRAELQKSRQQEERLKVALTRVLKIIDDARSPR